MGSLLGGAVNQAAPSASSLDIQTSNYGRAVPIVYGTNQIAGNLIWYGDFKAVAQTSNAGKGGSSQTVGYTYYVAALLGLCEGPLGSITEKTSSQWSYRGYSGGTTYTYNGIRTVYSGQAKYTPAQLGLTVFTGTPSQTPYTYITANHPSQALNYKYLAYVGCSSFNLGSSPTLPQQMYEVVGILANVGATGIYDAKPYSIAYDILTNTEYGAGFPSSMLADLSGNYTYAAGLWISPTYTDQKTSADIITQIALIANCEWVWSGGVLNFIPYGLDAITGGPGVTLAQGSTALGTQTYTPTNATPVYTLTDSDFICDGTSDPVIVIRNSIADTFNSVSVRFSNRFMDYADGMAEARDMAAIQTYGLRQQDPIEAPEICDPAVALAFAQLQLQRVMYIRNTYKFTLGYRYILLDPMDLVVLNETTGLGVQNQVVRITSITENEDGTLEIEAEDVVGNTTTVSTFPQQLPAGYIGNYNTPAPAVNTPVIFDAAGRMTATGYEIWIAASGGQYWGGAYVWVSLDGTTYKQVGTIHGSARYGSTTSSVGAGSDPDTTDTFPVDLTISAGTLSGGSTVDADNANTLCWLDGELISYSTATLTATNKYTLQTYTRRGVYGTPNKAHSSGAKFVRLDGATFAYAYDRALIGKTIYVKLQSFNLWGAGLQDISTCTAYTYSIGGPIGAPQDVTGASAAVAIGGVQLSWNAVNAPDLANYEIRQGTSWATATFVARSLTTQYLVPVISVGSTAWLIKAMNKSGTYSINAAGATLSVTAPSTPSVTAQVIDNNVLLSWSASTATQPVATYEIRKGATFAGATVIGKKSGLFTSVFETAAGTYTYWVVAIDSAGNYGTGGSVTAVVNAPPDYVLKLNVTSTFSGTFSGSIKDPSSGQLVLPVDITTQYQTHFTGNSWAGPSAQVSAGKTLFIEPAASSGYYEEFIDTGASIVGGCKVTASWSEVDIGTPGVTCSISYSSDNVTYTTLSATSAAFLPTFRYLKIRLAATSSGGLDLAMITNFAIRLDAKVKSDSGTGSAVSTDSGGTVVTFATSFATVTSITVTAGGTTPLTAVYNFAGGANPTSFQVLLFNSSGTRVSGPFSWSAKGY